MAKLRAKQRNSLPPDEFGLPSERKYPMPDREHAANAKARASQMFSEGRLSARDRAHIDATADRKLGSKD